MKRLLLLFLLCFGLALPGVAADGTSFNPTTISVKSVGASIPVGTVITWPSNSWPSDRDNWLECNGQSISSAVYPELVGVVGSRVPDYRGRFLRGLQSGHSVGQTVANSIKSHNHTQPTHTHSFSGQLVSTALSGTAAGQSFSSAANLGVSGWAAGQSITNGGAGGQTYQTVQGSGGTWISISQTGNDSGIAGGRVSIQRTTEEALKDTSWFGDRNTLVAPGVYEAKSGGGVVGFTVGGSSTVAATTSGGSIWGSTGGGSISGTASGTVSGTTNASGVSGALRNGSVSGSIGAGGGTPTDYTGGAETAPDHIYVRCLIRAKP
ncbi:MAG TPA: tail fiber protein [Bilophila wadsworthia]|uniref:phage tail protein n=2 Tax=Bilophila wadsworthia TaxID=35833 RepID=UPI001D52435B|nr:phage tail protein [Bilophila wadsworthia]HJH13926.1 tail fiber protein [Bilophila wadsworthia]